MIWRYADVDEKKSYRLGLCQSSDGVRGYKLVEINDGETFKPRDDIYLFTEPVQTDMLKLRNLKAISNKIRLSDGQAFFVDSHGVWITESEKEQMKSGKKHSDIDWITGVPPKFPPM
jgi:hypothetical protein